MYADLGALASTAPGPEDVLGGQDMQQALLRAWIHRADKCSRSQAVRANATLGASFDCMRAVRLWECGPVSDGRHFLRHDDVPIPDPGPSDVLIRVKYCGVCHTELDEIEGRAPPPRRPVILGHQVVGIVVAQGAALTDSLLSKRVGVGWIFSACGNCAQCCSASENLCAEFCATGRDVDGGYAEYIRVPWSFAAVLPDGLTDIATAPLLCAGSIGYRSLRLTGLIPQRNPEPTLGLTGFGASAHLVLQMTRHLLPGAGIFVFSRSASERQFARSLGALWTGEIGALPPVLLDAIIDTTPAYRPVVEALRCLAPGGRLVINALRKEVDDKEAWLALDYPRDLWLEKEVKSVANVTRDDVTESLALAARAGISPTVTEYPLDDAESALVGLRAGVRGATVLKIE